MRGIHEPIGDCKWKVDVFEYVYSEAAALVLFLAVVFSLFEIVSLAWRSSVLANAPETVFESPRNLLQVPHSSSTSGLSALGLLTPLIRPQLGGGVSALSAGWSKGQIPSVNPRELGYALLCCLWKARLPQRRHRVCVLVCRLLHETVGHSRSPATYNEPDEPKGRGTYAKQ